VENPPQWVKGLLESGMVTEVYKFSKFIHGSAVLLTEVPSVSLTVCLCIVMHACEGWSVL
jgi:SPX domain protein involved in polyphosphate accumulation